MKDKKDAAQTGKSYAARVRAIKHSTIILRTKRHVVKVDTEQLGYVIGGLLLGLGVLIMSILLPITFGGY